MKTCRCCGAQNVDSKTWCVKCLKRLSGELVAPDIVEKPKSSLISSMEKTPMATEKRSIFWVGGIQF